MPNILFVFAFVCFLIAAWQDNSMWNRLIAIGLAAFVAAIGIVGFLR